MAVVLTDVRTYAGGADLTSQSNKIELTAKSEEKETTTFGSSGWKEVLGGIASAAIKGHGNWSATDLSKIDDQAFADIAANGAYSIFQTTAGYGDTAYLVKGMESGYTLFGAVGDVAPWDLDVVSSWPLIRGKGLHPPGTARTATGDGTAVEHVAVSSSQYLYGALHVLSVSGTDTPTLTVKIQSDTTGFPSATDRISFTAATAIGGQITRVAGPITDTFYRASWTISGTNPSFLFVVTVGVA